MIEVFHSEPNKTEGPRESYGETRQQSPSQTCITPNPIKHTNVIPTNFDHIPSNTKNSVSSAVFYVFEDNEAVIKNDYQRSKLHNETCFTDPQSCSGLVE